MTLLAGWLVELEMKTKKAKLACKDRGIKERVVPFFTDRRAASAHASIVKKAYPSCEVRLVRVKAVKTESS